MTDNDRFDHFLKKTFEVLHLHFKHYLPVGKPEPLYYRDVFYQLYKIYDSGVLEEMSKEPIVEEQVRQLDMIADLFNEFTAYASGNGGGTLFDNDKSKTP